VADPSPPACWGRFVFARGDEQREGTIRLSMPDPGDDGRFSAVLVFEGAELDGVRGVGDDALAAATDALRRGSAALDAFRASGGQVLQRAGGTLFPTSQLSPFTDPLEQWATLALRRHFGVPEQPPGGVLVAGPLPEPTGFVRFIVAVDGNPVPVLVNQNGVGAGTENLTVANAATKTVHHFLRGIARAEQLVWFRESARLRRRVGNPPDVSPVASTRLRIVGDPRVRSGAVFFNIEGAAVAISVIVTEGGTLLDDCEDWPAVTNVDRFEAMGIVLHRLLADPDGTKAFGLDPVLLAELYGNGGP